jgi:hypothetical protein
LNPANGYMDRVLTVTTTSIIVLSVGVISLVLAL